ncbi:ferredoxin [Candidatus Pacearchaeota archaeon]|nr:ferredoxin [Candidatus Pacearchaeota archaeon]|tara:strand:+ start:1124 stop:1384 length:261 start_codon:yes stop_codon:yes gene_type:complete
MARIVSGNDGQEADLTDGDQIKDSCEELGVPFNCRKGICGTCLIEVEDGMENLEEKNDREVDMGLSGNQRLACQCRIKSGIVKIKY